MQVRALIVVATDEKLCEGAKSTLEALLNVTSPRLSRPSANCPTNAAAAAFMGVQDPLFWSEPERSITSITFTSRRVAVARALTILVDGPTQRMNINGTVTEAVVVTVR